jgi:hypothetical protein
LDGIATPRSDATSGDETQKVFYAPPNPSSG